MSARALVTGASGMLGGYIADVLRERGWAVRALARRRRHVATAARQRGAQVRAFERRQRLVARLLERRHFLPPARRAFAASAGRWLGHFTTPCAAGMKARQRSASSRNSPR